MKWEFTPELWRALRRGKIVAWVQLVAVDDGHEYRPYVPNPDRKDDGPQWVQLPPCQTLAAAKRAVLSFET